MHIIECKIIEYNIIINWLINILIINKYKKINKWK